MAATGFGQCFFQRSHYGHELGATLILRSASRCKASACLPHLSTSQSLEMGLPDDPEHVGGRMLFTAELQHSRQLNLVTSTGCYTLKLRRKLDKLAAPTGLTSAIKVPAPIRRR